MRHEAHGPSPFSQRHHRAIRAEGIGPAAVHAIHAKRKTLSAWGTTPRQRFQYYLLAQDVSRLSHLCWVLETSMLKTLASKHRTSATRMARKYKAAVATPDGPRTCFEVRVSRGDDKKPLVARFGLCHLQRAVTAAGRGNHRVGQRIEIASHHDPPQQLAVGVLHLKMQTGSRRRWPEDLPGTVEVYRPTCLVALGRPARGSVGDLPGGRAAPLTSNADINGPGRWRHTAATYGIGSRGEPRPSRGEIELVKRWSHDYEVSGSDGSADGNVGGRQRRLTAGHSVGGALSTQSAKACPHLLTNRFRMKFVASLGSLFRQALLSVR